MIAPTVRGPRDLPALRLWLIQQWQPGRPFWQTARLAEGSNIGRSRMTLEAKVALESPEIIGKRVESYANWEQQTLRSASLWWVAPEMVDLLEAAERGVPRDVVVDDLPVPDRAALVVFARPLLGVSRDGTPINVDAILWGPSLLPPVWDWWDSDEGLRCASVSSYACMNLDDGLTSGQLSLATPIVTEALQQGTVDATPTGDLRTFAVHGDVWLPLGRSDWPHGTDIAHAALMVDTVEQAASFEDDRRLLAALWTLLHQEGIAMTVTERPARPVVRRVQRAGLDKTAADVRVVTLRKPRDVTVSEGIGEHVTREWSHQWLVSGHWRNQPVGPGRKQRRLVWVNPYTKGPADKPFRAPTVVKSWVR